MQKFRRKKVYARFRYRKYDVIRIPEIRLEGNWLRKLGFTEGKEILIEEEPKRLVISVMDFPDNNK